jgi:hypothetical protein
MSQNTVRAYFTFSAEQNRLLDQLKEKTGKEKRQVICEAVRLALSKGLEPTQYQWDRKKNRVIGVDLPNDVAQEARRLWSGRLTPLAVSGILDMAKEQGLQRPGIRITSSDVQELKKDLTEISQRLDVLGRKLPTAQASTRITNSTTAVKAVRTTLQRLLEQLEYFKQGTETDRKKFRELIDPMEVGYVSSLLKALFDEEGFQRWILATQFTMGEKK